MTVDDLRDLLKRALYVSTGVQLRLDGGMDEVVHLFVGRDMITVTKDFYAAAKAKNA